MVKQRIPVYLLKSWEQQRKQQLPVDRRVDWDFQEETARSILADTLIALRNAPELKAYNPHKKYGAL